MCKALCSGFAQKEPKTDYPLSTICARWVSAQKVCAVLLCLVLLFFIRVSAVEGRTNVPICGSGSIKETEFSPMVFPKNIIVGNYSISIDLLSCSIFNRRHDKAWCWGWCWGWISRRRLPSCGLLNQFICFTCANQPNLLNPINLWGKDIHAGRLIGLIDGRLFRDGALSGLYTANKNLPIQGGRSSSIDTNNKKVSVSWVLWVRSKYCAFNYDKSSIFKLPVKSGFLQRLP